MFVPLRTRLKRLLNCQSGLSAVEFSLLAPFMVVGALSTVDAGMAVYDKMMMSQVLRAGSHSAIADSTVADVRSILETTAADNFTVAQGDPAPGELAVDVVQYCICANDTSVRVACTATCTGGGSPNQFYELSANMEFNGVMLPNFTLAGEMSVMAQ